MFGSIPLPNIFLKIQTSVVPGVDKICIPRKHYYLVQLQFGNLRCGISDHTWSITCYTILKFSQNTLNISAVMYPRTILTITYSRLYYWYAMQWSAKNIWAHRTRVSVSLLNSSVQKHQTKRDTRSINLMPTYYLSKNI